MALRRVPEAQVNAAAVETQIRDRLAALAPEALELLDESALHVGHAEATGGGPLPPENHLRAIPRPVARGAPPHGLRHARAADAAPTPRAGPGHASAP